MTAFYDLPEAERVALTKRAMAEKRTVTQRWDALADKEASPWSRRAELAAAFLAGEDAVADLGCGTMTLERYLADGVGYHPVDVARRDARTLVCDFNLAMPPPIPASAAACLGLIEYLHDAPGFLAHLAARYRVLVVSYNCAAETEASFEGRRGHAWVNDYTRARIEDLFDTAGWIVSRAESVGGSQILWRLDARALQPNT